MPIFNRLAKVAVKPLPKILSPKAHAMVDYIIVGTFILSAGAFWRRSKRAAIASLLCAGTELAVSLLTDYPGGIHKILSFETHGEIDLGLAAMTATMPEFLAFGDDAEKKLFLLQGAAITVASELTQFPEKSRHHRRERLRAA